MMYRHCRMCRETYEDNGQHECEVMAATADKHGMPRVTGFVCYRDDAARGYTYKRGDVAVTVGVDELLQAGVYGIAVLDAFAEHLWGALK